MQHRINTFLKLEEEFKKAKKKFSEHQSLRDGSISKLLVVNISI